MSGSDDTVAGNLPTAAPPPETLASASGGPATPPAGYGRDDATAMRLQPGQTIDVFRIEDELGAGGMGVVYRARHLGLDRLVALKVHRSSSREQAARLEREAKAMAQLRHPNVVDVYDVRQHQGMLFVAMEYLDGGTLRTFLQQGPSWRSALKVCLAAGEGLVAAHRSGLVHRDFKPDNVLLDRDGRVKVADFGLARRPGIVEPRPPPVGHEEPTSSGDLDRPLTRTGALVGTPAYMAPEQFSGSDVDARADQFAFCVVLYEVLYGRRPFPGRSLPELAHDVLQGAVVTPPADHDAPSALFELIRLGLQPAPERRHPDLATLLSKIRRVLSAPARRRVALAVVAGAVLMSTAVAGLWLGYRRFVDREVRLRAVPMFTRLQRRTEVIVAELPDPQALYRDLEKAQARKKDARMRLATDPDAFSDPEVLDDALQDDSVAGLLAAAAAIAANPNVMGDDPSIQYETPAWDGLSTLTCPMNGRIELRNCKAKVAEGPAIDAQMNCKLRVIDCDIEAETIVRGQSNNRIVIEGGDLKPRKHLLHATMPIAVHIRDVVVTSPTQDATIVLQGGKASAEIVDSDLWGDIALQAGVRSKVVVRGGRLRGESAAVEAGVRARVSLQGVAIEGPIERKVGAIVEQVD